MLALVPANVYVATQEIREFARNVDPNGDRTLCVLTKPDLVDEGTEPRVIELVEGRAKVMKPWVARCPQIWSTAFLRRFSGSPASES